MTRTIQQEIDVYVAAVQAAFDDLPASERNELIGDIRTHLSEVIAELDAAADVETVRRRLGSPEEYALKLREAAGYGTPRSVSRLWRWGLSINKASLQFWIGLGALTAGWTALAVDTVINVGRPSRLALLCAALLSLAGVPMILAIRRGLPPAVGNLFTGDGLSIRARIMRWMVWVLRAWGAVHLIHLVLDFRWAEFFSGSRRPWYFGGWEWSYAYVYPDSFRDYGPALYTYFRNWPAFVALLLSIAVSVLLGRQEARLRVWRILVFPINVSLIVVIIVSLYLLGPDLWPLGPEHSVDIGPFG
ncbi:HAAS signaling domain-containing protein [Actinopolymorpha alba]|uniref:HAAS signaling domain-containing protein n=1 Tax=Actinopolymorpha alba TaxID=533267 RepID=UPI000377E643|nr:hypothetical protein [Actinopolymorpha alba]